MGPNDVKGLPFKWDKMKMKKNVSWDKGKGPSKKTGPVFPETKDNPRPFTWG